MSELKKQRAKKLWKVFGIVVLVIFILFVILIVVALNSDSSSEPTSNSESQTLSDESASLSQARGAKTDELIRQARSDAENITDAQTEEAVEYIYNQYGHYFDSDEIMENIIYYGYLLEYGYSDDYDTDSDAKMYTDLGSDAYRLVKYVYRGTESATDERISTNLEQIREDLSALGYSVN